MWKEQHLYGSSRLGMWQPEKVLSGVVLPMLGVCGDGQGVRLYELTNHLGNVLATINDKGKVVSAQDYYPFGLKLDGRHFNTEGYRFGFNGKEYDGVFKSYDYGARMYKENLGRWLSIDPRPRSFISPYVGFNDNPIMYIDPDGRADIYAADKTFLGTDGHKGDGRVLVVTNASVVAALRASANKDALQLPTNSFYELPPFDHRQMIKDQVDKIKTVTTRKIIIISMDGKLETMKGEDVTFSKYEIGGAGLRNGEHKAAEDAAYSDVNSPDDVHVDPLKDVNINEVTYTWHLHPTGYSAKIDKGGVITNIFIDKVLESDKVVGAGSYKSSPTGERGDIEWAKGKIPNVHNNFVLSQKEQEVYMFNGDTPYGDTNSDGNVSFDFFFTVKEGQEYKGKKE